jgi:hypothetical protein
MEQFNKLIEFRQAVYDHGLIWAKDAQFELVDALLLSPPIRSFPELSLSPVFRRRWSSAYDAIERGEQDWGWLESYFMQQIPGEGMQVFSLDGTAWPHPAARVLADRQYVYSPTAAVDGRSIVVGHPYSVLAWVPERGSSWAPAVSVRRASSQQTDVTVGVEQVKRLCQCRQAEMAQWLHLIAADAKYGNHRFFGPLKEEPCGALARMRRDRVLYGEPGAYSGRGRPRVHGDRFAFKEPQTWGEPAAMVELEDERWGKMRLRRWDHLHARQDANTPFSVILVEAHLERAKPSKPFWMGYQPPPHQEPGDQSLPDLWRGYQHRWPVEPSIRFRKQYLYWTLPRFQTLQRCDRWSMLVSIAQWELFLARDGVKDNPLPWQPTQQKLTPERVLQSLGGLFGQIDTPAAPPQTRGKSPGWPQGRQRIRSERHKVVKKTNKKPKGAKKEATAA